VVPATLRAFGPEVLFTQCGADTYHIDPLADLRLSVDGQRASYLALRALADELCEGRWIATGGGGYALIEAVPRAWTHLLAIASGEPIAPDTLTPIEWRQLAKRRLDSNGGARPRVRLLPDGPGIPLRMTDGASTAFVPWTPGDDGDAVDRAVLATRMEVFPLLGLDPRDPRD
jgi:acetoin utilization protein AcuC